MLMILLSVVCLAQTAMLSYALWIIKASLRNGATMLETISEQRKTISFWKRYAQRISVLVHAKEGVRAVLEGKDLVFEHPDPAEQAEANRLMADLKRLAETLKTADAVKALQGIALKKEN